MTTAPLHYTVDNDDTSFVDGNFIARLGLLSIHVFYANQHWEKLLHCGSRLWKAMRWGWHVMYLFINLLLQNQASILSRYCPSCCLLSED